LHEFVELDSSMDYGRGRGNRMVFATFPGPKRPIAQQVTVGSLWRSQAPDGECTLGAGRGEFRESRAIGTFNWKITANLLLLREIGVYHTATAA
jgi:hypothetical protein